MLKYIPLNFTLMSNPVNWVIVALVLLLGGLGLTLVVNGIDISDAGTQKKG